MWQQNFNRHWIQIFGCPEHVTHDQGGEFELSFIQLLEQFAIPSTLTKAHAGWQLSVGERHGDILGTMLAAITAEHVIHVIEGYRSRKSALAAATSAKNMTVTRDGHTHQASGSELKYRDLTEENVGPSYVESSDSESEFARAHKMRITARLMWRAGEGQACHSTETWWWRSTSSTRHADLLLEPHACVQTLSSRRCLEGPSDHFGQRRPSTLFRAWRGRALLLAQENIRLATKEELALNEPAKEDAEEIGHLLRDPLRENAYRDQSHLAPPRKDEDPERKKARLMLRGTKSIWEIRWRIVMVYRCSLSRKKLKKNRRLQQQQSLQSRQRRDFLN